MSARRLVLALLGVVVALPVLAYATFPWWSASLLDALLNTLGVELRDAELERPGLQGLHIRHLSLDYRLGDRQLSLSGRNWQIRYDVSGLFAGRIGSLDAEDLELVVSLEKEAVETGKPLSLPLVLPGDLLGQIPLDELHIDQVLVRLPGAQIDRIHGGIQMVDHQLSLRLAIENPAPIQLDFLVNRRNEFRLLLARDGQMLAEANNLLQHSAVGVTMRGALKLNPGPLAALLQQMTLLDAGFEVTGDMRAEWKGTLPAVIGADTVPALALDGHLQGNIGVKGSDGFRFDSTLDSRFEVRDGRIFLPQPEWHIDGTVMPKYLKGLSDPEKLFVFNLELGDGAEMELSLANPALRLLEGELEISVSTKGDEQQTARLEVDSLRFESSPDWRGELNFKLRSDGAQFNYQNYRAEDVGLQGEGRISWTSGQVRLEIKPGLEASAGLLRHEEMRLEKTRLETRNALAFQLDGRQLSLPEALIELQTGQVLYEGDRYGLKKGLLGLKNLTLDLQRPKNLSAAIDLRMDGLQAAVGGLQVQPMWGDISLDLGENRLRGSFHLNGEDDLFEIAGRLEHDLGAQSGRLDARAEPIKFDLDTAWLPRLLADWPYPFDLSGGKLEMSASMQWSANQVHARYQVDLKDLAGFYARNLFRGLNGKVAVVVENNEVRITVPALNIDSLDVGFPVTDIRLSLFPSPAGVEVRDFSAELLGGMASQKFIAYGFEQRAANFDLQLENLQLEQILQLEQGISGSGILSGHLPIRLRESGVSIQGGEIRALPPGGYISYRHSLSPGVLADNAQLKLAMEVLRNFQFKSLDMMVDYAESGDLRLQTRVSGRNPDLVDTRPVNFNLNIKENIPTLLKSLQLTQRLSDEIEKRINDFYQ